MSPTSTDYFDNKWFFKSYRGKRSTPANSKLLNVYVHAKQNYSSEGNDISIDFS